MSPQPVHDVRFWARALGVTSVPTPLQARARVGHPVAAGVEIGSRSVTGPCEVSVRKDPPIGAASRWDCTVLMVAQERMFCSFLMSE